MKSTILSILFLAALVCFTACKSEKKDDAAAPADPAATEMPATPSAAASTDIQAAPPPASTEPAQNAKGVWHYICAKGCEGGAGAQGTCAKCGGPLQHNAAYHQ
jgi:hypothetical protein